jgi:hypothetical protein
MDFEELLETLDIESPTDLVYFEQFAELMEISEEIPLETLCVLFEGMEPSVLVELISGYFEEITQSLPDGEDELYTLLFGIDTTLQTLASNGEDETMRIFAEEFYRVRTWYLFEPSVLCTNQTEGDEREITLFEALTEYRAKNYTDDDLTFDFTNALSFQLDEYIVSVGSLYNDDDYNDDDDYDDDEDDYDNKDYSEHDDNDEM